MALAKIALAVRGIDLRLKHSVFGKLATYPHLSLDAFQKELGLHWQEDPSLGTISPDISRGYSSGCYGHEE